LGPAPRDVPPTLIVTAEYDPLRDDGERYAQVLREAGKQTDLRRYPGMIHGFFQMTGALTASRQLHADLGDWMRNQARERRISAPGMTPLP
jgi:acetyl esterase